MAPAACSAESPPSDGDLIAQLAEADMPPQGSASPISSPYGAYLAGLVAQSDGDLEAAADYMLQALTYDPDNPDLLYASRSEEHTSELPSLMRISYACFCLKK